MRYATITLVALIASCAPRPKNVACGVDADCKAEGAELSYCLESRCVECLSQTMCGGGEVCVDGQCVNR